MEVTRVNFEHVLPEIEDEILSSHFLAIDGEFTGLHEGEYFNAFDTPSQYYTKLRSGGMNFLLIQLGLCAFKYNKETEKFSYKAYNFYIFPRPINRSANDPKFLCQSSSLNFLISQNFDFNKLFKEGIPYLTEAEEKKLRENLEEKQKIRSNNSSKNDEFSSVSVPEEHVALLEDVCTQIKNLLAKENNEELVLEGHNGFVRKLIYQTVAEHFDNKTVSIESRTVDGGNRVLVVTKALSEEERRKKLEENEEKEKKDLDSAVGVSRVIRMISQSGKLIVGHNMLLDLCHIIHQFSTPLPESYSEFKELVSFMFPRILDTKYMSCNGPFKDLISSTVLGHLHKTLSEKPFTLVKVNPEAEDRGYLPNESKAHEAAFDAYLTGICFLSLANYLGSLEEPPKSPVLPNSSLLQPYINKLHLMRVQDVTYINLKGEDIEPTRDHVFHVTFPKDWKKFDLMQLFSPFGTVTISWLTDVSAYVGLHRRDQAQIVLKTLTQSSIYSVETYMNHKKRQMNKICQCQQTSHTSHSNAWSTTDNDVAHNSRKRPYSTQISKSDDRLNNRNAHGHNHSSEKPDCNIEENSEEIENADGFQKVKRKRSRKRTARENSACSKKEKKIFDETDTWE